MLSLERWRERFGNHLAVRGLAERTIQNYVAELRPFFEFMEARGIKTLGAVTRDGLEDYRTHLFYAHYRGKPLTLGTQARRLGAIRSFFRFLVGAHHIVSDPAARLELPKVPTTLPRAGLSEQEITQLLEAPDVTEPLGLRDRAILEVLYGTGARNSELAGLTLDDLDLRQREVRILRGKGRKGRVVPLGDEAHYWIEAYVSRSRPFLFRKGSTRVVFLSCRGNPISRHTITALVHRLSRKAELEKDVTPHVLRHCCATHMLRRGAGLRHLQELLGHSSVDTTQRYTRVEVSDLKRVHRLCHPREIARRRRPRGG